MSITSQITRQMPITGPLARFASEWRWEDIPVTVRDEAKRSLLNFFAVALGGCNDPAIAKAAAVLRRFRVSEVATVIGRGERTDLLNAAALNAMSANVYKPYPCGVVLNPVIAACLRLHGDSAR